MATQPCASSGELRTRNGKLRNPAARLCEEARHLHSLGLGIDLVAGHGRILTAVEKEALPGEVWLADLEGIGWRVPVPGALDELVERHGEAARRVQATRGRAALRFVAPPAPPTVWREVGYVRRALGRARRCHVFTLVDAEGDPRSFDPRRAIEVAAWLRHAAHLAARSAKLDETFVQRFVCGHADSVDGKNDRLSYLPIPTIPHKGRDGRIRRVFVVEPFGARNEKALSIARRLAGSPLVREGTGEIMAELRLVANPRDGVVSRYLPTDGEGRPTARAWGSVTPVVLPGHDDRRSRKAVGLVLKALAQAGHTTPVEEVSLQAEPVFPGAEIAGCYRVPAYLKDFPRMHAIIAFAEPVPGPVALGAGRHIGLGVFAAMN